MVDYDSDSSGDDLGDDVLTNVLLGYSSVEPVDNASGQLGGHPVGICSNALVEKYHRLRNMMVYRHGSMERPSPMVSSQSARFATVS